LWWGGDVDICLVEGDAPVCRTIALCLHHIVCITLRTSWEWNDFSELEQVPSYPGLLDAHLRCLAPATSRRLATPTPSYPWHICSPRLIQPFDTYHRCNSMAVVL
jgi:hypothetical protein